MKPRYFWLDIWRVAAACLVFLTHYKPIAGQWHALADEGHTGVALFFVLSGLVLGHQLWQQAPKTGLPGYLPWWRAFYTRRFAKIYVLHTLLYLVSMSFLPDTVWEVFLNLTLAKGLFPTHHLSGLQQSWSLTAELMLYAGLPLMAWAMHKWGRLLLIGTLLLAIVFSSLSWFAGLYTVAGRAFAFVVGLELARLLRSGPKAWQGSVGTWAASAIGVIAMLLCLGYLAQVYAKPALHAASTDTEAWQPLVANTVLVPLFFGLGIWLTRGGFTRNRRPPLPALNRMITLLAQSSYAFYLIHIGPTAKLVYLLARHNNLLAFAALWILSIVIHKTLEYPILRIMHSKGRIR